MDADTVDFEIDLGFDVKVDMRLRIKDLHAPEARTTEGKEVEAYVLNLLSVNPTCTIKTVKVRSGEQRDKYGRYVADVTLVDGSDLRRLVEEYMAANNITDRGR